MKKLIIILFVVILIATAAGLGYLAYVQNQNYNNALNQINSQTEEISDIKNEISSLETPNFETEVVADGLNFPWDIIFISKDKWLYSERNNKLTIFQNENKIELPAIADVYVNGEGGMMGLAIDSKFNENSYIYTCFNSNLSGNIDVRVVRWKFDNVLNTLNERKDIVTGIPSNISGRHSGCQLEFGPDDALWISTGDAAIATNPQDPKSLGGKILRVDRDGNAVQGNLGGDFDSRIYSYGHRNGQGLAFFDKPISGVLGVNSEHGSDKNDEVNPLTSGNFGWNPGAGYNESVPMTDKENYPDAISAIWDSGNPTIAVSGAAVIKGSQWKLWNNAVAFAALKGERIVIVRFDEELNIVSENEILKGTFGRIRTVQQSPDGNLYALTGNGSSSDKIIKIIPE